MKQLTKIAEFTGAVEGQLYYFCYYAPSKVSSVILLLFYITLYIFIDIWFRVCIFNLFCITCIFISLPYLEIYILHCTHFLFFFH